MTLNHTSVIVALDAGFGALMRSRHTPGATYAPDIDKIGRETLPQLNIW